VSRRFGLVGGLAVVAILASTEGDYTHTHKHTHTHTCIYIYIYIEINDGVQPKTSFGV
jgi:hypothetical protein